MPPKAIDATKATAGRTTVWGTPPASKPELEIEVVALPPIFLVGERLDRRRLAKILDGRDGISCAPDTELLADLVGAARRNWPALAYYGYPEQYWLRRVAGFFDSLQCEYAASRGCTRWAAMADPGALALIDRLFPRCRVLRVVAGPSSRKSRETEIKRQLSTRYYQLNIAEITEHPDTALASVLSFLDPLVEDTTRP
jgi:hypothetical protein